MRNHKFFSVIVLLIVAAVILTSCGKQEEPVVEEDNSIKSETIVRFECDFASSSGDIGKGMYVLKAYLGDDGETVQCSYSYDDQSPFGAKAFDFTTSKDLFIGIQKIIVENELEQFNETKKLYTDLQEYTGSSFSAVYDSNEKLEFSDNKDNLLSAKAMKELESLFYNASGASSYDSSDKLNALYYIIYGEEGEYRYYLSLFRRINGSVSIYILDKQNANNFKSVNRDISPELLDELDVICRENLIEKDENSSQTTSKYVTEIGMRYGSTETIINTEEGITRAELKALEDIIKKVDAHMKLVESNW